MLRREVVVRCTQTALEVGMRLDQWLLRRAKWPWPLVQKAIRRHTVAIEKVDQVSAGYKLKAGDVVLLPPEVELALKRMQSHFSSEFPSWVVSESSVHILLNKPKGLPSQGGRGISVSVDELARNYCETARIMHRLDKDTSGLLAIAKTREACSAEITGKTYIGVVAGWPAAESGVLMTPIVEETTAKAAQTSYSVLGRSEWQGRKVALVQFLLHTGRKHQIRIQSAFELRCPLLGDAKYSGEESAGGFYLHSWKLQLQGTQYTAPPPSAFQSFLCCSFPHVLI